MFINHKNKNFEFLYQGPFILIIEQEKLMLWRNKYNKLNKLHGFYCLFDSQCFFFLCGDFFWRKFYFLYALICDRSQPKAVHKAVMWLVSKFNKNYSSIFFVGTAIERIMFNFEVCWIYRVFNQDSEGYL